MSLNIPDDELVKDAIFVVMYNNYVVKSQKELTNLVRSELNRGLEKFNVSCERVRRLAINGGLVRVIIEYRDFDAAIGKVCPVCGNDIVSVENHSLSGDIVEVRKKCSVCTFSKGVGKGSPGRYVFVRKRDRVQGCWR